MFARPVFGNPYQQFGGGLSPFQPFAGGLSPLGVGNPFQQFTGGFSPLGTGFGGMTPLTPQIGGFSPISPFASPQFATGTIPGIGQFGPPTATPLSNPLIAAQLASINPMILPYLAHQQPNIAGAFGGFSPLTPQIGGFGLQPTQGWINPMLQPFGGEAGHFGHSPFSSQFGWGNIGYGGTPFYGGASQPGHPATGMIHPQSLGYNQPFQSPYLAQEPVINPLVAQQLNPLAQQLNPLAQQLNPLAQQLNPLAQQRLPIRSLVNPQQIDPYQGGIPGVSGSVVNQATDPYSTLVQAQLMSQFGINPLQQLPRPYPGASWYGTPGNI